MPGLSYIFSQLKRGFVSNTAYCLLMILAGTLLCLGTGLLVTAMNSIEAAEDAFTTIAMPDVSSIRRYADNYAVNNNLTSYEFPDGYVITSEHPFFNYYVSSSIQTEIMNNIVGKVYRSEEITMDTRRVFGAYIPGVTPYLSSSSTSTSDFARRTFPVNTAAFTTCVDRIYPIFYEAWNEERGTYLIERMMVRFKVEEIILLHPSFSKSPAFDKPRTIELPFESFRTDGTPFVEEGKRYFMFGRGYIINPGSQTGTMFKQFFGYRIDLTLTGEMESASDLPGPAYFAMYSAPKIDMPAEEWPLPESYQNPFPEKRSNQ